MPSVGSTPTTTSPAPQQQQQSLTQSMAPQHLPTSQLQQQQQQQQHSSTIAVVQQQHAKIQQQYSLPLQLQYQVTTTQPSPAGMFISQTAGIISSTAALGNTASFFNAASSGADISPTSSTASFSSVDTNQTLLNSIANQQQIQPPLPSSQSQQQQSHSVSNSNKTKYSSHSSTSKASTSSSTNRSYRTKYSQFMIITPAVSIDRDFDRDTRSDNASAITAADNHGFHSTEDDPYFPQNGNVFRSTVLQHSSIDSGNSSDSGNSFRSNYNPYIHTSRQHLLPKSAPPFYNFSPSSWRWCTLICAAMRCFGAGGSGGGGAAGGRHRGTTYSSSFGRPPYQRSRSSGPQTSSSKTPHRRLRSYSTSSFTPETAFEHFSAPFKARKTRDEQNNIAYEL